MADDWRADDSAVAARVLAGDRDAYRILVDRYGARVFAFCRVRVKSDDDASDAAQDVFVRAFNSLATFRQGGSFPAWLFAIAGNHLRTRFRLFSSHQRKIDAAAIEAASAASPDPFDEMEKALRAEELRRAVSALPPDMRWPVELYYFAELSVAETARVMGLGEEAVKTRLFRARKALRLLLEKEKQPKSVS